MHDLTGTIAERVRPASSTDDALAILDGAYAGETFVAVTCGPSLGGYRPDELRRRLARVPTIAVKQAIDIVGPAADFLCFNAFNVARFVPPSRSTIRVYQQAAADRWPQLNRYDLALVGEDHPGDLASSLSVHREFDDYLLANTPIRPWGPGIMYELVLYLALHMGAKRIVTVGWDIATSSGSNRHFYDASSESFFDRSRSDAYAMARTRGRLPDPLKVQLRRLRATQAHFRNHVYNRTLMLPGEAEVTAEASGAVSDWLARHGVELLVASPHSLVDDRVRRLTEPELWDLLERVST